MQQSPPSVPEQMKLAEGHFQAGRVSEAEAVLRQVLKVQPAHTDALHALSVIAYHAGKVDAAIQLLDEALQLNPRSGRFHSAIAVMYNQAGQTEKAIEHGRTAVELQPQSSEAQNNLGVAYFSGGHVASALACYDRALELVAGSVDALTNRANALSALGRFAEAEADCRKALAIRPRNADAYNNLGMVLREAGRPAEAEAALRTALSLKQGDRNAMHNLIVALNDQKKLDEALSVADQTLSLYPTSAEALCLAGTIHLEKRNYDTALRLINQSLAMDPDKALTQNALGRVYFETRRPDKAMEAYQRAIEMSPSYPESYNNLGSVYRELGQQREAIAAFEKCLSLAPDNFAAFANLAEAKTFTSADDAHLVAMEKFALRLDRYPDERQMHLLFALGKAYGDLGRADEAFARMAQGGAIKRRTAIYQESEVLGLFQRVRHYFTAETVTRLQGQGAKGALPIIVCGMPRSGTTLVEQILASHPTVRGAGEVREVNDALAEMRARMTGPRPYPELMQTVGSKELSLFAEFYSKRLSRHQPSALRISDKMPTNFLFLGLLHLAMPEAKLVHVQRDPVDTCLSCYSKLFSGEVNYTYDLAELGRYYRAYAELMQHWRAVLPAGAFLDVRYEDIVADTEGQARRLLSHCGLSWDAQVLDFHKTERAVRTASAAQVRQPIYATSVAKWKKYEKHLGPLLAELGDLVK